MEQKTRNDAGLLVFCGSRQIALEGSLFSYAEASEPAQGRAVA